MSVKGSKLTSILYGKCPRCHEGDMFEKGTLYNYRRFSEMHTACACCGQPFEPEPGFYYGAMYVSYAFSTAIFIGIWVILGLFVEEISMLMMTVALVIAVVAFLPISYRLSRMVWINFFVSYQGPCKQLRKL